MIPIYCDKCIYNDGSSLPRNCEHNAHFHKHECVACGHTIWLQGSPIDDDPSHTRVLMRGACYQLPKADR